MKKIVYFLIVLISFSCTDVRNDKKFVIKGKLANSGEFFYFIKPDMFGGEVDTLQVMQGGQFEVRREIDRAGYYKMYVANQELMLFVRPGDSLEVSADGTRLVESVSFTGRGAKINEFLKRKALMSMKQTPDSRVMYSMTEREFVLMLDSLKNNILFSVKEFAADPDADARFIELEEASVLYQFAQQRLNYQEAHAYYSKNDSFVVSDSFNDYLSGLDINNDDLMNLEEFLVFARTYLSSLTHNKLKHTDGNYSSAQFMTEAVAIAEKTFKNKNVKDFVIFSLLSDQILYSGVENLQTVVDGFMASCQNKDFVDELRQKAEEWSPLQKGKEAADFSGLTTSGDTISLSDFRGKYVYLDVWATWCGPCRLEIPKLKELEEKYRNRNIVFVSLSIDQEKVAWAEMVAAEEMKGVQIHMANARDEAFVKTYLIRSIPRFILIDKDGRFVNSNAERPTSGVDEILSTLDGI